MRSLSGITFLGWVLVFSLQANEKSKPTGPPPGAAEVRFTDGSYLKMQLADEAIEMNTSYGKLKIPTKEIRRLELATRIPDDLRMKIEMALIDLGSSQFKVREAASRTLADAKVYAYPYLLRVASSEDAEVAKRANELLTKLKEEFPAEKLKYREKDVIYTDDSMISGKLEVNSLKAHTQQFGLVQMKLSDIGSIAFLHGGKETEIRLDGQYALQTERWLDTKLDFAEGTRIVIHAEGEIDMYPTAGYVGQYIGSPKGKKVWPGNIAAGTWEPGTLIGKFGENGKVFLIGEKYEGPAQTGRLYLRAAGNPYNVQAQGEYKVKITGGTKGN